MAFTMPMKQIGVKNIGFRVELMEWSNKMDLIAIANEKGEIVIQRLNWQKVVIFPPIGEGIKVKALSWQPGEAIIAAGYSSGKVSLLDVEKEEEIFTFICDAEINTLKWTKTTIETEFSKPPIDLSTWPCDEDYLSPLPNLDSLSSTSHKSEFCSTKSFAKGSPNFLIISLTSGHVLISIFGLLPCGTIDIFQCIDDPQDFQIHDVRINSTLSEVYVFVSNKNVFEVLVLENKILTKYAEPLLNLALKHGNIIDTVNYINETIQCIVEAWETVLLEMDNKLAKYANSQPEGSVSADFLELLMFGYPSEALEQFLIRDLTEKGLKKLGNSIELSYSTIQKLVTRPLHSAAVNLIYHLNTVKGMSHDEYKYCALLDTDQAEKVVRGGGSFLIKIFEMQNTITQSVFDYKTFWCWLYMTIIRLMDENVPEEVSSVSQQDIIYLAEFLNTFDDCIFEREDGTVGKRKFNLEKVGQYLEDFELQMPVKLHDWNNLLNENECLRDSALIYPHNVKLSLIQEFNLVKKNIADLFSRPNTKITKSFELKSAISCANIKENSPICTSFISNEETKSDVMFATTGPNEAIFLQLTSGRDLKASRLQFNRGPFTPTAFRNFSDMQVKHLQLYNENTLSLLLQGTNDGVVGNYFIQMGLADLKDKCLEQNIQLEMDLKLSSNCNNFFEFLDISCFSKPIDGTTCTMIAVSGSRKVASILSDNCRKIRLYEMEVEDEDDEMDVASILSDNCRKIRLYEMEVEDEDDEMDVSANLYV